MNRRLRVVCGAPVLVGQSELRSRSVGQSFVVSFSVGVAVAVAWEVVA